MIHRRLTNDDERGLAENLFDHDVSPIMYRKRVLSHKQEDYFYSDNSVIMSEVVAESVSTDTYS